jgi:sulfur carrier protein ThiS
MQIHIRFRPRRLDDQTIELESGAVVMDAMRASGAAVDTYVACRGGKPLPEDAPLADGDELLLISAASGG